jgi:hypothetical protein
VHVKAKSPDENLDVWHEPHGTGDNLSPTLRVRTLRAIEHKDQGKRNLEKLAELEEKCPKLRIFSCLCVEALLLKSCSAVINPNTGL